jgi:hypothetical protein
MSSIILKLNANSRIPLLIIASFKNDEREGTLISSPYIAQYY